MAMIVNLTKHAVNIFNEDNQEIMTVEPSGFEARIKTSIEKVSQFNGVPLFATTVLGNPYVADKLGNEETMLPQKHRVIYIVSGIFRSNFDREDLYQPGRLLRDKQGKVIGCVGLSR